MPSDELRLGPVFLAILVFFVVFGFGIYIGLDRSEDWSVSGFAALMSFLAALAAAALTHEILIRLSRKNRNDAD